MAKVAFEAGAVTRNWKIKIIVQEAISREWELTTIANCGFVREKEILERQQTIGD